MATHVSAPLLSRVKSWQLIGLGLSGWCTLYSVAMLTWGASSGLIGNTQGGCFAATMTLAGFEAKRCRRTSTPPDPFQWLTGISTEKLNQTLAQNLQQRELLVEAPHAVDVELGFGVRAVNTGRTMVYETSRWKEPVIDLAHVQTTEDNRKRISAELAIIVGAGKVNGEAKAFARTRPLNFLVGKELKAMLQAETPVPDTAAVKKV